MINLDFRDPRPLYEQIAEKISDLAARGVLAGDTQLPPVRQLALDLSINPNTIQRAYSELEKEGVIYSLKGKGNYISSDTEHMKEKKCEKIYVRLRSAAFDAFCLGIGAELLKNKIDEYSETFQKGGIL